MKIFNKFKINFLSKAYTEGIYADTPANRKLGRVGMTYEEYAKTLKKEDKKESLEQDKTKITKKEGEKKAAEIIKKHVGFDVDFTFRKEKNFTVSFKGNDKSKITKIQNLFKEAKFESDYDEELDETFVYIDLNKNNTSSVDQIKEKIKAEIKKLKKKNDYVTLSDGLGNTYRFSYNRNVEEDAKGINECLVKNKEGKVLKTFKASFEEDLLNSVSKYIKDIDTDLIISSEEKDNKDINEEKNLSILKDKMKEAKDKQLGTIIIKGEDGKLVYLNRKRQSRWLKDFEAYTIRDSKKNILASGKANTEEELMKKLKGALLENKVKLIEENK